MTHIIKYQPTPDTPGTRPHHILITQGRDKTHIMRGDILELELGKTKLNINFAPTAPLQTLAYLAAALRSFGIEATLISDGPNKE